MKIKTPFFIILWSVIAAASNPVSYHKFEIGGALSLYTFNKSLSVLLTENAGYNLTPSLNFSLSGEQLYRNHSFTSSNYSGVEYRFTFSNIQLPVGMLLGFKTLHIGSFSKLIPICGATSGLYFKVADNVQIRSIYRGKLYFDSIKIWGNDLLLGICFLFKPKFRS